MPPTLLAPTLYIPAARWNPVITTFFNQLGTPTQVEPKGPLVDAELVVWGTGKAELRCQKAAGDDPPGGGGEYFVDCPSADAATRAFELLKSAGLTVKSELQTIREYVLVGKEVQERFILLGSFYLTQPTQNSEEDYGKDPDTVGIIHNPNYPDASYSKKWRRAEAAHVFSYLLAGLVGAALTAWLSGRRGPR